MRQVGGDRRLLHSPTQKRRAYEAHRMDQKRPGGPAGPAGMAGAGHAAAIVCFTCLAHRGACAHGRVAYRALPTLWYSFVRIALGFFIALVLGVVLAMLAGRFRLFETLLWPYMLTVKSVPVASFVIIILIFFTAEKLSAIISALMVLPIIYTNTLAGIRAVDPQMDRMARSFCLSPVRRFLYVRLPQIRPYSLSGCSVALGLCWKSGIAAELIGQPMGSVGNHLYLSKIYLETADLFCWTLLVVLISFLFEKAVVRGFCALFDRWEKVR